MPPIGLEKSAKNAQKSCTTRPVTKSFQLELDRSAKRPLAEQIRKGIGAAIESGALAPGAHLPSWQDLAAWRRPRHRTRGLRKAVPSAANRCIAGDRNPCRGAT